MTDDLHLRRKWTFRAHGAQVVFVKRRLESAEHVFLKAFLWALYLPDYPDLKVEIPVGDRYKPDLVSLAADGRPRFWGEAGQVGSAKIASLARRYRDTHLALAKWAVRLDPVAGIVRDAVAGAPRRAPFDLLSFPADSAERFIDPRGAIEIDPAAIERLRIE